MASFILISLFLYILKIIGLNSASDILYPKILETSANECAIVFFILSLVSLINFSYTIFNFFQFSKLFSF